MNDRHSPPDISPDAFEDLLASAAQAITTHLKIYRLPTPGRIDITCVQSGLISAHVIIDGSLALAEMCADLLAWRNTLTDRGLMFVPENEFIEPMFRLKGKLYKGCEVTVEARTGTDGIPSGDELDTPQSIVDWLHATATTIGKQQTTGDGS
ncbi:hypothetical protein [Actinokineospora inagensis]|uniref:hypothetical protein n=1 Tax=Actinokineospora inagensis TaxID=103730 RepID=UPI0004247073|nr:hypothetical protein [Actinokineospora inagensis]